MDMSWYPVAWITFVFLGPPVGPVPIRRLNFSGKHYDRKEGAQLFDADDTSPMSHVKLMQSREKRKQAEQVVAAKCALFDLLENRTVPTAPVLNAFTTPDVAAAALDDDDNYRV
jgi:hypothetical protein